MTIGALARSNTLNQARRKAEEIISSLKLHDKKDKLGHTLTVIERKRLELARALATEPKLLLIDEVIAGLNPTEVDEISNTIRDLVKSGLTILMIEHVMRAVLSLTDKTSSWTRAARLPGGSPPRSSEGSSRH